MADLGDKSTISRNELEEFKNEAKGFLNSHYFYAAAEAYERILKDHPNDKDAHIGLLLTSNKIDEEDKLIRYYQDLYSEEEYEIKLAADKEEDHIEEMCNRYVISDYLEKDDIRKVYDFDLSYRSNVFSRKRQKEEIEKEIRGNEHLSWLKEKGFREISDILKVYDQRIEKAEEEDRNNIQRIKGEYQRFLYKAYSDVKDLYQAAKQRKEDDYQELVRQYDALDDIDALKDLSLRFEQFRGYKDGSHYIDLCKKKAEEIRSLLKDKSFKQVIDNSLAEAKAALVTGKYSDAYEAFNKIIALDAGNEEGYLGVLMARTKTSSVDELFDYYKNLYSEESRETLEACEEDSKHIEEMAERYCLPDYLDKEEIREKYSFDRTYRSCLSCREKQEKQFIDEIETDPVFSWLRKNASESIKKRIRDLYDTYALRIKEAKEEDKKKVEQVKSDYQRFLFKTYSSIRESHKRATDRKENSYKQLLKSFELADSEQEFKDLIGKLEDFGEYKECGKYISLCRKKIEELKEKEKEDYIDQDIETSLISGKAYLSSGNEELAEECFNKVLSMDPEDPRAYLGILMLETGSKNVDELVSYYSRLYNDDEAKIVEACKEETSHIEAMEDKYALPGYLEKETIAKYYNFDRSFESFTSSRQDQRDQFNEELRMNPLLAKVAAGKDSEITSFIDRVKDSYERRITESKKEDESHIASLRHIYDVYLAESDKTVIRLYEEKLKEKNEKDEALYLKNIELFNKDLSEEELEELIESFDLEYKDSPVYVKKCKDRIKQIRKEKQADRLTSLLQNGTALLESDLYEEAKKRFESYLEIDPDEEDVYIKLLMAEKKVNSVTSLFNYYKDLYSDEISETKEAVEENTDHIEDIVERCYIPGSLEKEAIRKRYVFDRSYESLLQARLVQKSQIEDEINIDPLLSWLNENGSDRIKGYIEDVLDAYDQRIEEAEEADQYNADLIQKEYRTFLRNTDKQVRSLYNELNREKNRKLKEEEKKRKEEEREAKEKAEYLRKLKEEEERQNKLLVEKARRIVEENEKKRLLEEKQAEEKKKQLLEQQRKEERLKHEEAISAKFEEDRRRAEISQNRQLQNALAQREKLEREAFEKAERARRREEKQRKAQEARLLKEEKKRKKAEEKAQKASGRKVRSVKTFKPNFALIAAALSLAILTFVVYVFVLEPRNKYNNALELVENKEYDEAVAVFEELGNYKDSEYQVKNTLYLKADDLYKQNEVVEAAKIFNTLRFDDSEERVRKIKKDMIENAKVGDSIYFGDYEQDGDTENGKEMIEWIVLDEQEGSILVISKFALDAMAFNSDSNEVYWENSSIRSWLNGRFPDNAFSKENPSDVLQSTLTNYKYPEQEDENEDVNELVLEEYETRDRIFLLSSQELEQYYPEEDSRKCEATYYAIENGVSASADDMCNWWLRSPGSGREFTEFVWNRYGTVVSSDQETEQAVRPAMWLKRE